jgi:hypothetical protein
VEQVEGVGGVVDEVEDAAVGREREAEWTHEGAVRAHVGAGKRTVRAVQRAGDRRLHLAAHGRSAAFPAVPQVVTPYGAPRQNGDQLGRASLRARRAVRDRTLWALMALERTIGPEQ